MEVKFSPTPEQEAFIREAIKAGRFQSAEDAAREALLQWQVRERQRSELLVELDAAEASLARGEGGLLTTQSIQGFIENVKQRGVSRLMPTT
ncbi:MAG: ribbon-helix-helix domain-containing protein [Terriglobia bacterium]